MDYDNLLQEIDALKEELKRKENIFREQNEELKRAKDLAEESKQKLKEIVETAVGDIGQDFFNNIIVKLAQWLNSECVVIGRITEDQQRIDCVPLYLDGKILHDFSYKLADSPCDITTRKGFCCYMNNVIQTFPKDTLLVDLGAEGYVGTALYNKEGKANGVICAVSRTKLEIPPQAEEILKIIGARVSAEIERKKIELALEESSQKLKESNAAKDKFFSIIAHDLKNPFNTIMGFMQLLESRIETYEMQKIKKILSTVNKATENTHRLLNNLLTWARTQQGTLEFSPEPVEIESFMDNMITQQKPLAIEKDIELSSIIVKNVIIQADLNMLSSIMRNLLFNAVKFTKEGGRIVVKANILQNKLLVEIEDNGIGISPENLNKLFNIEYAVSTRGTRSEKGTGMGLVLCREFVKRHGGEIWAESTKDKGSTFYFTIPLN